MSEKQRFDDWPERYDRWFETPVGKAVLKYESELILDLLRPSRGERILDAGSGTGIFTREFLARGAAAVGLDISLAMLQYAAGKAAPSQEAQEGEGFIYAGVAADMTALPFADGSFDKTVSVAALEFVADEKRAVTELFRVTKPGGAVVIATLNSLSPWAARRSANARRDPESIFNRVFFRSPLQLLAASPVPGIVRTAVHFGKEDDPAAFDRIERPGKGLDTGAFVAARWVKP
ncbi:MAG: class I SAM-dependent methyltransferase [Desulfobacterales bacterium]|nr:class I SAM-dependent methyltransferase [Desulfobacterales bacterium]